MSELLKALEAAERDDALRRQAREQERRSATSSVPPAVAAPRNGSAWQAPATGHVRPVDPHLVSLVDPISPAAEQYRALRHVLEQARRASGLGVVAVSAPTMGDGKTTTAINLAGALAQSPDSRVLLMDLDLRRPVVSERLGLDAAGRGVLQLLVDPRATLADVVRPYPPFNLSVLTAGSAATVPYELLKSPRLGEVIATARETYDWVVVDTPPLVPISDCRVLGELVDGFIIVVTVHRTSKRMLSEALNVLDPGGVLGLVFNGDDDPHYGNDYYAGYGPSADDQGGGPWWKRGIGRMRARWGRRAERDDGSAS